MKPKYRNLFLLFGIVAIVIMLYKFDFDFRNLRYIRWYWLSGIVGIWIVVYLFNAGAFYQIVNERNTEGRHLPFLYALKYTISGFAFSYATPFGFGGGPYRMLELGAYVGTRKAASSVVLYSMMHIFSHLWFWLTGVVLYVIFMPLDVPMCILLSVILAFCIFGIYLFVKGYKNGMVVKTISLLCRIPFLNRWARKFADEHSEDFEKIDSQISELQSQNTKSFYASFFLEYIGRFLQAFEIYFMLQIFMDNQGGAHAYLESVLILAFTSLFANLLFFMPLQLGGREGGFAMSTANLGMTSDIGMFISIICRVRELFWTSIGLLLMKVGNNKKKK